MKEQLKRLVSTRGSLCKELHDNHLESIDLLTNINVNFKIKLTDMTGPLKILFSYPESSVNKSVSIYLSNTT